MKTILSASLITLLLAAGSTNAAPAAWQLWRSKLDGRSYCAQNAPGPGWAWADGPFRDSRCLSRATQNTPYDNHLKQSVDPDQTDLDSSGKKRVNR
ncbi:MAG: hypothetical protein J0M28_15120 [Thauera sp.]|nr:hypothetical protein [Thauera sp.]